MRSTHRFLPGFLLAVIVLGTIGVPAFGNDDDREFPAFFEHIRVVDFEGEIAAVIAAYVDRQATAAFEDGVDCLVLRIDSPGGTVLHSQMIADRLLEVPDSVHVIAWIPERAYSGAAMVALGCDEIVMRRSAHFGDAQPGMPVAEGWRPAGEKAESPLRAKFRQYAYENGYPVALAEAMVSARLEVLRVRAPDGSLHYVNGQDFRNWDPDAEVFPGVTRAELVQVGPPVVREDDLLTLTADEAQRYGFLGRTFGEDDDVEFYPDSEETLLEALKAPGAEVDFVSMSVSERASKHLLKVAGILSAIVAISLMLLIWQGPGIMTIVGGIALVLVLLITSTADQLHGFPIFLLVVGLLLLVAEVFVIPGFGVAGILGIASLGAGFLFLAAGATIQDPSGITPDLAMDFGLQFVLTLLLSLGTLFLLSRFFPMLGPGRRMILAAPGAPPVTEAPSTTAPIRAGQQGIAASPLRPSGAAEIDGQLVDVVADGTFIERGRRVAVILVEGNRVVVETVGPASDPEDEGAA